MDISFFTDKQFLLNEPRFVAGPSNDHGVSTHIADFTHDQLLSEELEIFARINLAIDDFESDQVLSHFKSIL